MRTLLTLATALACAALWCAPTSSADEVDAMERDAKAAGVTMDFKTGAVMGALCTGRGMPFAEMPDATVISDLVAHGRSQSEATAIWNIVKKNCTQS